MEKKYILIDTEWCSSWEEYSQKDGSDVKTLIYCSYDSTQLLFNNKWRYSNSNAYEEHTQRVTMESTILESANSYEEKTWFSSSLDDNDDTTDDDNNYNNNNNNNKVSITATMIEDVDEEEGTHHSRHGPTLAENYYDNF